MTDSSALPAAPRQQKVQSAETGTGILKALAELAPSTSLSKLAEHVGMPASKVHRYLQALIASGFAEQDAASNRYGLGREALMLGLAAINQLDVLKIAAPYLMALRDELEESCFLAVWANKGPTVVQVEPSRGAVTLVTHIGSVLPLLGSSTGMVFNAFLPDSETASLHDAQAAQLPRERLDEIEVELRAIRQEGLYSIQGLLMAGVNAVSAPVFMLGGRLAGVLTVVGSASVFDDARQRAAGQRLLATARTVSERMAGTFAVAGSHGTHP